MNLFDSGIKLPERVFVVAPGLEGRDYYAQIKHGDTVIAVSRGVLAYPNPTYWLCSDARLVYDRWFRDCQHGDEKMIFSEVLRHWCRDREGEWIYYPDYTFSPDPVLSVLDLVPREGVLRCGATVSAQALQMAYWFGAKHVTFVGVDMRGRRYFDGTPGNYKDARDEEWPGIVRFNLLIEWLQRMGMTIDSLSPTALRLKVVKR